MGQDSDLLMGQDSDMLMGQNADPIRGEDSDPIGGQGIFPTLTSRGTSSIKISHEWEQPIVAPTPLSTCRHRCMLSRNSGRSRALWRRLGRPR